MAKYEPLRVHARLANGVAIDPRWTLDGLLSALTVRVPALRWEANRRRTWRRVKHEHGEEAARRYFEDRGWPLPEFEHQVPLSVWGHGYKHGLWVFCASYGEPDEPWEWDTQHWSRRVDALQVLDWVQEPPRRIETGKGEFKSYYEALPLMVTAGITWHVHGHQAAIERMLAEAPFLGKKRSQGYGEVLQWTVEPADEDRSVWNGDEVNRPIPLELLELMGIQGQWEAGWYGYRPPYHDSRNLARCAIRGRREPGHVSGCREVLAAEAARKAFG